MEKSERGKSMDVKSAISEKIKALWQNSEYRTRRITRHIHSQQAKKKMLAKAWKKNKQVI
jgi:hypothetical protein